jgi:hypothetical protein
MALLTLKSLIKRRRAAVDMAVEERGESNGS